MPRTKIEIRPDLPSEYRAAIEPLIRKWSHILPSWCRRLVVQFDPDLAAAMSTLCFIEYRKLSLLVHPPFLHEQHDMRELYVVHEFAHAILAPVMEYTKGLINDFTEEGDVIHDRCRREFIEAMEGSVEDTAYALVGDKAGRRPAGIEVGESPAEEL